MVDPGAVGGVDLMLRKKQIGGRISSRGYYFRPYISSAREEVGVIRPQVLTEFIYQW